MFVRVLHTYAPNVWECLSASCILTHPTCGNACPRPAYLRNKRVGMLVRVRHTHATNVWGCLSASCMLVDKHTFLERGFDGTFCTDATAPGKPYCRDDRSGMVAVASDLASADRSRVRGCDRRH